MTEIDTNVLVSLLRKHLIAGRRATLIVSSNSMAPLLRQGDQIHIELVTIAQLRPGDILTVMDESQLLTHRLWQQLPSGQLLLRGDRQLKFDRPQPPENLVGLVRARYRGRRCLSLSDGWGLRLNRHLARLAALESRRLRLEADAGERLPSLSLRASHRLVYWWAASLTFLMDRAHK